MFWQKRYKLSRRNNGSRGIHLIIHPRDRITLQPILTRGSKLMGWVLPHHQDRIHQLDYECSHFYHRPFQRVGCLSPCRGIQIGNHNLKAQKYLAGVQYGFVKWRESLKLPFKLLEGGHCTHFYSRQLDPIHHIFLCHLGGVIQTIFFEQYTFKILLAWARCMQFKDSSLEVCHHYYKVAQFSHFGCTYHLTPISTILNGKMNQYRYLL